MEVIPLAVGNVGNQTLWFSEFVNDYFDDFNIQFLIVPAENINFADFALSQNGKNPVTTILNIQPVTNVQPFAVYRKWIAV